MKIPSDLEVRNDIAKRMLAHYNATHGTNCTALDQIPKPPKQDDRKLKNMLRVLFCVVVAWALVGFGEKIIAKDRIDKINQANQAWQQQLRDQEWARNRAYEKFISDSWQAKYRREHPPVVISNIAPRATLVRLPKIR